MTIGRDHDFEPSRVAGVFFAAATLCLAVAAIWRGAVTVGVSLAALVGLYATVSYLNRGGGS